jgi:hypothetical protein
VHDTADSRLLVEPLEVGVDWIAQEVPFHTSANVWLPLDPTASQKVAEMHDTPAREVPAGLGVDCLFHEVPFHVSASAADTLELLA